jgi:hypothetical protein
VAADDGVDQKSMRWTTTDPRSAGFQDRQGATINYVTAGAYTTLQKVGTGSTDWAEVSAVITASPMAGCPTVSADPRSSGRAGSLDEIVLYYTAGAGVYLIKYGAGDTDWVALPTIATSGAAFGSGTTNKLAKWTSATTIGDSSITDTGALVTIPIALALTTKTQGSVLFVGPSGVVTEDNSNFFWDNANNWLGIGTNAPDHVLDVRGGGSDADVGRLQSTNANGYSTLAYFDNSGTGQGFLGHANASAADTTTAGRNYWRTVTHPIVFTYGTGVVSTAALYIHGTNGNVNIGASVGDPSVKLRVQGSTILGSTVADTHTLNGDLTVNAGIGTSVLGIRAASTGQANVRATGGSSPAYTGFVVEKDGGSTELWFIGRNGVDNTDGLVFLRGGNKYLEFDTSGNATFKNRVTMTAGAQNGTAIWEKGNGSPEGVIAAPVGSFYSRLDGGAGTSWYVKESGGSGDTGWVGK